MPCSEARIGPQRPGRAGSPCGEPDSNPAPRRRGQDLRGHSLGPRRGAPALQRDLLAGRRAQPRRRDAQAPAGRPVDLGRFRPSSLDALDTSDVYDLIVERHRAASPWSLPHREPIEWLGQMAAALLAQSAIDRLPPLVGPPDLHAAGGSLQHRWSGGGQHASRPPSTIRKCWFSPLWYSHWCAGARRSRLAPSMSRHSPLCLATIRTQGPPAPGAASTLHCWF